MYYIKLNDCYLQVDDRDTPFFSEDKVGELYTTHTESTADHLLQCLYPGIPFSTFTLEVVTYPSTKYHRYIKLGAQYLVWCTDGGWHNESDLPHIEHKPKEYDTPREAVQLGTVTVKQYAHTVL